MRSWRHLRDAREGAPEALTTLRRKQKLRPLDLGTLTGPSGSGEARLPQDRVQSPESAAADTKGPSMRIAVGRGAVSSAGSQLRVWHG